MLIFLIILPVLGVLSSILLYNHNGKREFLKFDLVQFIYAFVLLPLMFVWMKSFMFVFFRNELAIRLSVSELFVIDTAFSTLFMFIYAFVVIHSLTKSFDLRRVRDPLYDIFEHSEYYHQLVSHLVIYIGTFLLTTCLSMANLFVPVTFSYPQSALYGMIAFAVVSGVVGFTAVWNYQSPTPLFMRIMKLVFGLFFILHGGIYLLMSPNFNFSFVIYWFTSFLFLTLVILSVLAEKPESKRGFARLPFKLNVRKSMYYWRFFKRQLAKAKIK